MKGKTKKDQLYISYVKVEGYKSLSNIEIDFKPGLNIIIGKNGAGKSNLIHIIEGVLQKDRQIVGLSKAEVKVSKENREGVFVTSPIISQPQGGDKIGIYSGSEIIIEGVEFASVSSKVESPNANKDDRFELCTIPHQIPSNIPLFHEFISFEVAQRYPDELWAMLFNADYPYFLRRILSGLFFALVEKEVVDEQKIQNAIIPEASFINALKINTPIQSLRVSKRLSIDLMGTGQMGTAYKVRGLGYEFQINGEWYDFWQLSDGTKRIVLIFFNLYYDSFFWVGPNSAIDSANKIPKVILFEEPELGVHPHQLHLLMLFIKELSRDIQIILTTHSPQVLDILDTDELDQLIIANFDPNKGSQFRHLTEKETKKAVSYMTDQMFLSDYWRYSDLEGRETL